MDQNNDLNSRRRGNDEEYIVLGRIGAPFGVLGFVNIQSFTEELDSIFRYKPWYLKTQSGWQTYKVLQSRPHRHSFVVKLEGCENRDQAALLTNLEIGVLKSKLPRLPKGEYYWSDLVGLKVINEDNINLGIVSHLIETGSNDVLVVAGAEREHLIPYLPGDVITKIDLDAGEIVVQWDPNF